MADAIVEAAEYNANPTGDTWWWLSFVDEERPEGDRFLGVLLIDAPSDTAAVMRAHMLGLNPGGEVAMWGPLTAEDVAKMNYPPRKLLTRAEIAAFDEVPE